MQRYAIANDADDDAFDHHRLPAEIHPYRFELFVLWQQPDARTVLTIPFDRYLVVEPRDDDLPAADFRGAMYRDEIAVENPGIFHAHAVHPEQVMRFRIEEPGIDFVMRLNIKQRINSNAGPAENADAKNLGARMAVNQKGLPAKPANKNAVTVCILTAQGIDRIMIGLIHLGGAIDLCSALNVTRVIITFITR